ncbi:tape measure protein [Nocardioides sp. STR2]|uniref:Tape measure protein n=1 Tax=Nocardioides pini TaxID=2975053 RepID=A0ABT4CCL0_9ACTN|nr:tape measure protein [Nocardioides pini]MCY4726694.1 tape measure protein [Nocardioides pini]
METIGYAALQVIPSVKGARGVIEGELNGSLGSAGKSSGKRFGGGFVSTVGKYAKTAGVIAGGLLTAKVIKGGIDRALNIDAARGKLQGLGHDAKSVDRIMGSALDSVKGTAFGLDAAATTAAGAVAAGVKPGKDLTKYLTTAADAATIAGVSMSEMGSILNKVETAQRAYTMELNMLADRGIPVYQWLQKEYGVTATELRKMVAAGEVDAKTFKKVIDENIGGAAQASGSTMRGTLANVGAAFSRLGATVVSGAFPAIKNGLGGVISGVDAITPKVSTMATAAGGVIMGTLVPAVKAAWGWFKKYLWPAITEGASIIGSALGPAFDRIGDALGSASGDGRAFASTIGPLIGTAITTAAHAIATAVTVVSAVVAWFIRWRQVIVPIAGTVLTVVGGLKAFAMVTTGVTTAINLARGAILSAKVAMAILNLTMAANPLGVVIVTVMALVAVVTVLWKRNETFRRVVTSAWNAVQGAVAKAGKAVGSAIGKVISVIAGFAKYHPLAIIVRNWGAIMGFFQSIPGKVRGVFSAAGSWLRKAGSSVMTGLRNGISGAWGAVASWVGSIRGRVVGMLAAAGSWLVNAGRSTMTGLRNGISGAWGTVTSFLGSIPGRVRGALAGAASWLVSAGRNVVSGLVSGIRSSAGSILSTITSTITDKIPGWVKKRLGIRSPSRVMAALGVWIPRGLAKGISAGASDSDKAMKAVADKLSKKAKTSIPKLANQIMRLQRQAGKRINRATAERRAKSTSVALKAGAKAARKLTAAQQKRTKALWKGVSKDAATDRLLGSLFPGGALRKSADLQAITLKDIAKARDVLAVRLEDAKERLKDALSIRDDFKASVVDSVRSFTSLLNAEGKTNIYGFLQKVTASDIAASMRDRLAVVQKFAGDMASLLASGLNKDTYAELVAAGPEAAGDYAAALAAGGATAVAEVNDLNSQISAAAESLGATSSTHLYQAGVDAAQGLVAGIESQMDLLTKAAEKIAKKLTKAIKKALKIKSPSRVMAGLGQFIPAGLAVGMGATSKVRQVTAAAAALASNAAAGVRSGLAEVERASTAVSNALAVNVDPPAPRMPYVPPPFGGDGPGESGAGVAGPRVLVQQTINNPQAEPTSKTVDAAARTLGMVGAL